jgi:hypothetical protein
MTKALFCQRIFKPAKSPPIRTGVRTLADLTQNDRRISRNLTAKSQSK